MESIGSYLRREREFRKISIDEIATATRIKGSFLSAVEKEDFDGLPGRAFARGYIKAYAGYLGLDVSDVMLRYEHWLGGGEVDRARVIEKKRWRWRRKHLWAAMVVVAVLVLAAFLSSL